MVWRTRSAALAANFCRSNTWPAGVVQGYADGATYGRRTAFACEGRHHIISSLRDAFCGRRLNPKDGPAETPRIALLRRCRILCVALVGDVRQACLNIVSSILSA